MNLLHLLAKRDKNLVLTPGITTTRETINGRKFGGLRISPGAGIKIRTAAKWYPINTRPATLGWQVKRRRRLFLNRSSLLSKPYLHVSWRRDDESTVAECRTLVTATPSLVDLPRLHPDLPIAEVEGLHLFIENPPSAKHDVTMQAPRLWLSKAPATCVRDPGGGTGANRPVALDPSKAISAHLLPGQQKGIGPACDRRSRPAALSYTR